MRTKYVAEILLIILPIIPIINSTIKITITPPSFLSKGIYVTGYHYPDVTQTANHPI